MTPVQFNELLKRRGMLILDGGISTMTKADLSVAGAAERLCVDSSDEVREIHRSYINAGANIITTNSFGAKSPALVRRAAQIAREVADEAVSREIIVAGSIAPMSEATPFETMVADYRQRIDALAAADLILIETSTNLTSIRAVLTALQRTPAKAAIVSVASTSRPGTLLSGESFNELANILNNDSNIVAAGLNCSPAFDNLEENIEHLERVTQLPLAVYPNAGHGTHHLSPAMFARRMHQLLQKHPSIAIAGGCCGTTSAHIKTLSQSFLGAD